MSKALVWLFYRNRFTYGDLLVFFLALVVGGWAGFAVIAFGFSLGAYIGGVAKAWRDDKGRG